MNRPEIRIGSLVIGDEHPPFVIAEAGVHHDNSIELAKALIRAARVAGAHAIKFQTYSADRIAARWAPTYWDSAPGLTQYDIFAERSRLSADDYAELIAYANELGIIFLSTPFDPDAASLLDELGMPAFKIASADLTNTPLLRSVTAFGKPIILSTGASTFAEITAAVQLVRSAGVPLCLMHCTLSYPTRLDDANLRRIEALREKYPDAIIGYSDHTRPSDSELACPLSVALGARIIEKHFTLNPYLPGDDHYHAVDPPGLARLVKGCREAALMTAASVEMVEAEQAARTYARRSIVAARPLPAGTIITPQDIDFKRPGTGLSPTEADRVVGKRLLRDLAADDLIRHEHLAPAERSS